MKKATIIIIASVMLAACGQSTESKIKKWITDYEKSDLKAGEKIESMKVDSIDYSRISLGNYYSDRARDYYDRDETMVHSAKLSKMILKDNLISDSLLNLSETADTISKIWKVKYHYLIKTNQDSYDYSVTRYFDEDGKLFNPDLRGFFNEDKFNRRSQFIDSVENN